MIFGDRIPLSRPSSTMFGLAKTKPIFFTVLLLVSCFGLASDSYLSNATAKTGTVSKPTLARLSQEPAVKVQGRGKPRINLSDGREVLTDYDGPAALVEVLRQN